MPESFFNIVAVLRFATLLIKRLRHRCFRCQFCEISNNTFSKRTPPLVAFSYTITNFHALGVIMPFGLVRYRFSSAMRHNDAGKFGRDQ